MNSATVGPAADTRGAVAFHNSAISNIDAGDNGGAIALHGANAAVLLKNVQFSNIRDRPVKSDANFQPSGGKGAGTGRRRGARLLLQVAVAGADPSLGVFSDNATLLVQNAAGALVAPQPLSAAPGSLFLATDEPWVKEVQQVTATPAAHARTIPVACSR
jgi:hypothetical protein